jgi:dephospho-CoA kinase
MWLRIPRPEPYRVRALWSPAVLVVGLTGGIGSGKSTVSALLAERGAVVVDADLIAREVVEPGQSALAAIVERFGASVLGADGTLDRPALGSIVFADDAARVDLERITHPAIRDRMMQRLGELSSTEEIVILDVPLLVESAKKGNRLAQQVIVVDCPEEVAIARLVDQRGMDADDARQRISAQVSREERLALADFVIDNSGSRDELSEQIEACWAWISSLPREP